MSDDKDPLADPGHLFDQTNGMIDGLDGESDGTAGADAASDADRDVEDDGTPIDDGSERLSESGNPARTTTDR